MSECQHGIPLYGHCNECCPAPSCEPDVPKHVHDAAVKAARWEALDDAARVAISHLDPLPNYTAAHEDDIEDKVEQGYGDACIDVAAAIFALKATT